MSAQIVDLGEFRRARHARKTEQCKQIHAGYVALRDALLTQAKEFCESADVPAGTRLELCWLAGDGISYKVQMDPAEIERARTRK